MLYWITVIVQRGKGIVILMMEHVGEEEKRDHLIGKVTTWYENDLVEMKWVCSKKRREKN